MKTKLIYLHIQRDYDSTALSTETTEDGNWSKEWCTKQAVAMLLRSTCF